MNRDIQLYIIKGLFENENYFRNVLVNLDPIYFDEDKGPVISFMRNHFASYEQIPEYSVTLNSLTNIKKFDESLKDEIENVLTFIKKMDFDTIKEEKWLFDETKNFINNRAMFLVLKEGAKEISKETNSPDYGKIEKKMRDALSMNWNEDLGIDYFDEKQFDDVYDILEDESLRIPTGIDVIDDAINGGIPGETKFCAVYVGQAGLGKCVSQNTFIKVRNKKTGDLIELPIGDFHNLVR